MAKQQKKEFLLTASGYQYDKDLSRVPVKVFPALQALIANQHDLIEIFQKYAPDKSIFIEAHLSELAEVEETIASEHARYYSKKEEQKKKRLEKIKDLSNPIPSEDPVTFHYDEPAKDQTSI